VNFGNEGGPDPVAEDEKMATRTLEME